MLYSRIMKLGRAALAGMVTLLVLPGTSQAQDAAAAERPGLEVTGHIGALLPLSPLADQGDTLKTELSTKPVFGATLDYWFGGSWGLSITGGISQPDLTVSSVDPVSGFPVTSSPGTADFVHGEATITWRPQFGGSAAVMLPYFGVGAGIRSLGFPDGSGIEDVDDIVFVLSAGGHIRLGERTHLRIDFRDLVSSFEASGFEGSKLQNEVLLNVGLGVKL